MKKLLTILFVLISFIAKAQPSPTSSQVRFPAVWVQFRDTATARPSDTACIFYFNNNFWVRRNSSTFFQNLLDGSGTVTSIATNNGTGITGGTITASGTLVIDTLNISTKLNVRKVADSTIGLLGNYVLLQQSPQVAQTGGLRVTDTARANIIRADSHVRTDSIFASNLKLFGNVVLQNEKSIFLRGASSGSINDGLYVSPLDSFQVGGQFPTIIRGGTEIKFINVLTGVRQQMPARNGVVALQGDTTGFGTKFIYNQTGSNLSAQTAKFWVTDSIRTNGAIVGNRINVANVSVPTANTIRANGGTSDSSVLLVLRGDESTTKNIASFENSFGDVFTIVGDGTVRQTQYTTGFGVNLNSNTLTSDRNILYPNASGTLALTSNVTDSASALRASINTKLNISDTAAMMNNNVVRTFGAQGINGVKTFNAVTNFLSTASSSVSSGNAFVGISASASAAALFINSSTGAGVSASATTSNALAGINNSSSNATIIAQNQGSGDIATFINASSTVASINNSGDIVARLGVFSASGIGDTYTQQESTSSNAASAASFYAKNNAGNILRFTKYSSGFPYNSFEGANRGSIINGSGLLSIVNSSDSGVAIWDNSSTEVARFRRTGVTFNVGLSGTTASLSGGLTISTTTTGNKVLNIGNAPADNSAVLIPLLGSNTQYNWRIQTNTTVAGAYELSPSTSLGGSTFGATAWYLTQAGNTVQTGGATLGGALTGTSGTFSDFVQGDYFQTGATPATSGGLRLGTQVAIRARNAGNTANVELIASTASDAVSIGGATARTLFGTLTDDGSSVGQFNGNVLVSGKLLVTGSFSSDYAGSVFNNNTTAGTSFGLFIKGGTNASDAVINANNAANTVTLFRVDGLGAATFSSLGTGTVYSNAGTLTNTNPSDFNLKKNIVSINYGLNEIMKLRPVSFDWKNDKINQGKQFGFIAQEVQKVIPELVKQGEYMGLDKEAIFTIMVKAIQELKAEIDELKKSKK